MTRASEKRAIVIAAAILMTGALAGSAVAQSAYRPFEHTRPLTVHHGWRHAYPALAAPLGIPVGDGVLFQTPFVVAETEYGPRAIRLPHYQGPDGTYEAGGLTQAINGTPCGQECTDRALVRWGYQPEF